MDSLVLTLTSRSSLLEARYFPAIELPADWVLGLIQLLTYNSIPNIVATGNKIFFVSGPTVTVPVGSYRLQDIEKFVQKSVPSFKLAANRNTLHSEIECDLAIDFTQPETIGTVLGFSKRILQANTLHSSDLPVSIIQVTDIRVECNITTNAYANDKPVHTIFGFCPDVPPGYRIIQTPNVIYLPVKVKRIETLKLRIVDQNNDLVDFRGEEVVLRLHLKSVLINNNCHSDGNRLQL